MARHAFPYCRFAAFSGSPFTSQLRSLSSLPGRLSQGSYIPFLYCQGLEKWIRLPPEWETSFPAGASADR